MLVALGVALAVLPAASAMAKNVGRTGGEVACDPNSVYSDSNYVVPSGGGTITSFSFRSAPSNKGQQFDFVILRPAGSGAYTVVGKTGLVTLAGTGLETFPADISVDAGDILGFYPPGRTSVLNCARSVSSGGGYLQSSFTTDPQVGQRFTFTTTGSQFDLNESANLIPPIPVYAGYADGFRQGKVSAPSPWKGSPGAIFEGCNYFHPDRCPKTKGGADIYNAGAIRIHNTTGQKLTITRARVVIGSCTFDPWPGLNVTLPAGAQLILTQTGGAPPCHTSTGKFNFDTSATAQSCSSDYLIPVVHFTVDGATQGYLDLLRILNTRGVDREAKVCGSHNATHSWGQMFFST